MKLFGRIYFIYFFFVDLYAKLAGVVLSVQRFDLIEEPARRLFLLLLVLSVIADLILILIFFIRGRKYLQATVLWALLGYLTSAFMFYFSFKNPGADPLMYGRIVFVTIIYPVFVYAIFKSKTLEDYFAKRNYLNTQNDDEI